MSITVPHCLRYDNNALPKDTTQVHPKFDTHTHMVLTAIFQVNLG